MMEEKDICLKCREGIMEHIQITRGMLNDLGEATQKRLECHDDEIRDLSTLLTRVVTIQEIQTKMAEEQRSRPAQVTDQKWFLVVVVVFSVILLASVSAAIGINLFDKLQEVGGIAGV